LSLFATSTPFTPTNVRNYEFHVEAVDRAGNITPSPAVVLAILRTVVVNQPVATPCGPPTGLGGCQPPP